MHRVHIGMHRHRLRRPDISMLCLPVPPEVHLPLERAAAELASEGLEAGVLPGVGDEVGALAEGLAADLALVGLLACGQGEEG